MGQCAWQVESAGFLVNLLKSCADTTFRNLVKVLNIRRCKMGIQNWSEDVILVDLPAEPQIGDEMKAVIEMVRDSGNCDVGKLSGDAKDIDVTNSASFNRASRNVGSQSLKPPSVTCFVSVKSALF